MCQNLSNNGVLDRSREGIIKSWFDYCPDSGEIRWKEWISPDWYKVRGWYTNFIRDRAGKPVKFYEGVYGHLCIWVSGGFVQAHIIAWVLTYGKMPTHHIDHIDGDPSNNRIDNLRDVPDNINQRNRKMQSNNPSGVTGVRWHQQNSRWQAYTGVGGKQTSLGCYSTLEEAAEARQKFMNENPQLGFTERHGKAEEKF